ncbi:MAG: DNA translocase FtsK, partial [Traorella sp.]
RDQLQKDQLLYDDESINYDDEQAKFEFGKIEADKINEEPVVKPIKVIDIQPDIIDSKPIENDLSIESSFLIDYSKYRLPGVSLLNMPAKNNISQTNKKIAQESGQKLLQILEQFGVKATLIETHIGPTVTKFEIKPDLGVKVSKISNLQNDIKLALAAKDIRIEAPIPSKSAVGIEIPNVDKSVVCLRELIRNVPNKYENSKLLFALGKDLLGQNVYGELNKMPHLLIAGATGSGKSVCVNSIIISILMRAKPDEVKLLLIDPKKVEFTAYQNIPHLIGPIINDGDEANAALKVIVEEMDRRYDLFSKAGVRNISGYNEKIEKFPEEGHSKLPSIVVIIDELADLMLVAAKDVEASIQRITQLARAAGIHLVVATQRPSVDVITGIIKANIPSRIAFAVSSAVDSRTILDQQGAEKLLGMGDMLYIPQGENSPIRVQGVYVSDEEVNRICEYVSKQGHPKYDDAFVRLQLVKDSVGAAGFENNDVLYEEAKQFVIESQKASTSLIQRKFSIGYQRAARLIDMMEENGIVGPSRGSKP